MIKTFKTKEDAKKELTRFDKGIYFLSHGEYARPYYTIRKVRGKDAYYIHVKRYYYRGTFNIGKSGGLTENDFY